MIAIIGGGIAGLVAAINIEKAGYDCTIFEKNKFLGGRLATDIIDGVPMDHGFQVLLTDYPYAKKYLDYSKLDLVKFDSGAVIYKNGKRTKFGDPIRDLSFLFPMLSSWAANVNDKILIYKLNKELRLKLIESIFENTETSTLNYLKEYGFSDKIITNFFKPFFGGIFLEKDLDTSSRMFEFVFKMFNEGAAAIPKTGIESIPKQLREVLRKTKIVTSTETHITQNGTISINGKENKVQGIVKAYSENDTWHGSTTHYYRVSERTLDGHIIGLIAESNAIINNFYYVNDSTISVTSLEIMDQDVMDQKIREELKSKLGITAIDLIKSFKIPKSLPILKNIGEGDRSNLKMVNNVPIVEAGDHLYYGSLNAAMHAGEVAANALIDHISC